MMCLGDKYNKSGFGGLIGWGVKRDYVFKSSFIDSRNYDARLTLGVGVVSPRKYEDIL